MADPLSTFAVGVLADAGKKFITNITGQDNEKLNSVNALQLLKGAYEVFESFCQRENIGLMEETRLKIFTNFLTHDVTVDTFKPAMQGRSHDVDYEKLEWIFTDFCMGADMDVSEFDFHLVVNCVIESLAANGLSSMNKLQPEAGGISNLSYARLKYLRLLWGTYKRLPFTGIPHPKEH